MVAFTHNVKNGEPLPMIENWCGIIKEEFLDLFGSQNPAPRIDCYLYKSVEELKLNKFNTIK